MKYPLHHNRHAGRLWCATLLAIAAAGILVGAVQAAGSASVEDMARLGELLHEIGRITAPFAFPAAGIFTALVLIGTAVQIFRGGTRQA